MTWGSPYIGDGSGCLNCWHIEACRERIAARTGSPVLCEGRHVSRGYGERLLDILSDTDGMTARELAIAADIPRTQASNWCIRGCAKGDVAIVGSKLNKGVPARIYAVVSPGDAMTEDELTGQGLAAVVASLDGRTG